MTREQRRSLRKATAVRMERSAQERPKRLAEFYRWWWANHRALMRGWLHSGTRSFPKLVLQLYREAGHTLGTRRELA